MLAAHADVCCANLPSAFLGALAPVRAVPGVVVLMQQERLWVRWEPGDERVLRAVLPVKGAVLYAPRDGGWHRVGAHLPAFDVPADGDYRPLCHVLFPGPVEPLPEPAGAAPLWSKQQIRLAADTVSRATTALMAPLGELLKWIDTAPSGRFRDFRGAICDRHILVLGRRLPLLRHGQRYWGERVLRPLGYRVDPDLPESALCDALRLAEDELLLLHADGTAETVPTAMLRPLTRAGVRRAAQEALA
jgi:hypothetical protein